MELRELGDRLFRLHAKLIIGVFLLGLLGGVAVYLTAKPQYQANTTLVMGAQDPQSAEEAAVLADTARGIATGPQLVTRVISTTGATRNEQEVAAAINVQALGNSGVLTLSVTDPNRQVAVKLANGLTAGVVNTRVALIENGLASSLRGLAQQEASTDAQIRKLNTRIQTLAARTATLSPQANAPALTQLAQLQARLTSLQQEAIQIAVQRNQLQAQQGPKTTVLDSATSATRVRGRGLINALLGGILGLVVGIALAGAREMLRPSLVGAHAISRAIGTPLLGEVNMQPDSWTMATLPDAGTYVELAADAQHMYEVRFAALEPGKRSGSRVRMLEGPLHKLRFGQSPATSPGAGTGLVVAVPRVLKLADVDALTNFIWISGWTLLGVIVYPPSKKPAKAAAGHPSPAASPQGSSPDGHVEVDA
jgi:capsular polysaccharide biosynthesis protein